MAGGGENLWRRRGESDQGRKDHTTTVESRDHRATEVGDSTPIIFSYVSFACSLR